MILTGKGYINLALDIPISFYIFLYIEILSLRLVLHDIPRVLKCYDFPEKMMFFVDPLQIFFILPGTEAKAGVVKHGHAGENMEIFQNETAHPVTKLQIVIIIIILHAAVLPRFCKTQGTNGVDIKILVESRRTAIGMNHLVNKNR